MIYMERRLIIVSQGDKIVSLHFADERMSLNKVRERLGECTIEGCALPESDEPPMEPVKEPPVSRNGRPWANRVVCIETGEIYKSVVECSKITGISTWSIYKSVNRGFASSGFHFRLVGPEQSSTSD